MFLSGLAGGDLKALSDSMHSGAGPGTELASGVGCRPPKGGGKPESSFSNF